MKPLTIPIDDIKVTDRQRGDYQDLNSLAESLSRYGLLQPIVLTSENQLIAGGRRLAAAKQLGWTHIPYINRDTADAAELAELEYEENFNRADLTWQEKVLAIDRIHQAKAIKSVADAEEWGYAKTGALLGVSTSNVAYCIKVAAALRSSDAEIQACEGVVDAIRLLAERKLKAGSATLAAAIGPSKRTQPASLVIQDLRKVNIPEVLEHYDVVGADDCVACGGTGVNSKGGLCVCGKLRPKVVEDTATADAPQGQYSVFAYNMDAIEWLRQQPDACLQCIYTDPPYGIDMSMLDQGGDLNSGSTSLVAATHDVEDNVNLFRKLIPEIARCLNGIAVIWCDLDHWYFLSDLAHVCGLRVQRWPIIWCKQHQCKNGAPYNNFTKSTEFAMLMATKGATLNRIVDRNWSNVPQDSFKYQGLTNPFWKPLCLHQWIIDAICQEGGTVVDLFAGCGSIPLAATAINRHCIAVEIDSTHYVKLVELCKPTNCGQQQSGV